MRKLSIEFKCWEGGLCVIDVWQARIDVVRVRVNVKVADGDNVQYQGHDAFWNSPGKPEHLLPLIRQTLNTKSDNDNINRAMKVAKKIL